MVVCFIELARLIREHLHVVDELDISRHFLHGLHMYRIFLLLFFL